MATEKAKEILDAWQTSSHYWSKHQSLIEQMYAPLTRALIETAGIEEGQSVLDIGGGAGEPSLTIAKKVGPSGRVAFTDPVAGMVESTKAEAHRRDLSNIDFHQTSAERLPFADNTFDAAVSRLSAMFFTDIDVALREVLRVVKPGGSLAFLVWASREFNPFFSVITEVLNQFVPADEEDENAPGAFRFATPGKLAAVLKSAGAADVHEREINFDTEAALDVSQFWQLRTEMSDTFRTKLAKLTPEEVAKVREATMNAALPYFKDGRMSFPSRVLIVSGNRV
ncbi:MAG TPA: class I SAM-dependent methyltransferase [Pyrinomonadaceae bacterium]|nr:class I SAM-dependent methyltransferase [Pyrinomonadaceae bacterium]